METKTQRISFTGYLGIVCAFLRVTSHAATFTVTNTLDRGAGSLRAAISNVNASAGPHMINFAIPPFDGTVKTITPLSELDHIMNPATVDGYTQPGARTNTLAIGDNAVLLIELNGSSLSGGANGLAISAGNGTVRGLVINRFPGAGVRFDVKGGNRVEGNFIGADPTGMTALGNHGSGVSVGGLSPNLIGGTTPSARNIISGNSGNGIEAFSGGGTNLVIQGNYIGTDKTGTAPLPNAATGNGGIVLVGVTGTLVGGAVPGAGNLISANHGPGIFIFSSAPRTVVAGNIIGADVTGTLPMGNALDGVAIQSSTNNVIGGTTPGAGNIIAFNGAALTFGNGSGVQVTGTAVNNAIAGNSIFGNAVLGIDLFASMDNPATRVTMNDPCDGDDGPNHLHNFPVLVSAMNVPGGVQIQGLLDGKPNTMFRLEFFANAQCDPSGFGEGSMFMGAADVMSGAGCTNQFNVVVPGSLAGCTFVTATATDPNGNTSEFSPCVRSQSSVCTPPPSGLVSWWPGEGNAQDIIGGNNGTLTNNTAFVAAKVGQTFRFDGSGDAVLVGNPAGLRLQSFTIDAWIKRGSADVASLDEPSIPVGAIFAYGLGGYGFGVVNDGRLLLTQVGGGFVASGSLTVTDTNYHHVAVTKSGNVVTFYKDGFASVAPSYDPGFTCTAAAAVGSGGDTLRNSFLGDIDEVEIFNRALSAAEVQAIFCAGSAGKCKPGSCTITCPPTIVATNAAGQCGAIVTYPAPTVNGNCGAVMCTPTNGFFFPVGSTTVSCTTTNGGSCSFTVTVFDKQNPTITCSSNIVVNAPAGQTSLVVNYPAPTLTDNCSGVTVTCAPASGSPFPVGTTMVTCTAIDTTTNSTACTFTVSVNVTTTNTPPTITCPGNITTNNTPGTCARTLAFAAAAAGSPAPAVTCKIGSTVITSPFSFPVGTTMVTCTATNVAGTVSCSFTVTVNDTEPPVLVGCPTNNFFLQCLRDPPGPPNVTATDNCDGNVPVIFTQTQSNTNSSCNNVITWMWTAIDRAGNRGSCTQTLTVNDTNAPVISGCTNLTAAAAAGQLGAIIGFAPTAFDFCAGPVPVNCTPMPGYFAIGQTPVSCEAVDPCGNRTRCSFTVTVTATTDGLRLCSFTQGFYGNGRGRFNGLTARTLVGQLLDQGTLVVGKTGRSLSIQPGDAALLQLRLPSGGTPAALPNNGDQMLQTAVLPLNPKGRFADVFLGQTITLSLNARLSPALLNFSLAPNLCTQGILPGPDGLLGTADDVPVASDIQSFNIASS